MPAYCEKAGIRKPNISRFRGNTIARTCITYVDVAFVISYTGVLLNLDELIIT